MKLVETATTAVVNKYEPMGLFTMNAWFNNRQSEGESNHHRIVPDKDLVLVKVIVMIGTHYQAIARFMCRIVFRLFWNPMTTLEISPLCFLLT
jgi:hypothetical protein